MTTVKLTTTAPGWPFINQSPGNSGRWGEFQFFVDREIAEPDYWVVANGLLQTETCRVAPQHTVLLTWEPPRMHRYSTRFLRQFARVVTCDKGIQGSGIHHEAQGISWMIEKTYDELKAMTSVDKTKKLSLITSNKVLSPGHRLRYEFALKLKNHYGDKLDLFGKGIRDFESKWDVSAPYTHSIVMENTSIPDYFSEKLTAALLAFSFPIYYGCSNIENYFPTDSFETFNPLDFVGAVKKIDSILDDPSHYMKHLPALLEARRRVLDEHQFFPIAARICRDIQKKSGTENIRIPLTLRPEITLESGWTKALRRLKRVMANG